MSLRDTSMDIAQASWILLKQPDALAGFLYWAFLSAFKAGRNYKRLISLHFFSCFCYPVF
jgi:hypothetical protein